MRSDEAGKEKCSLYTHNTRKNECLAREFYAIASGEEMTSPTALRRYCSVRVEKDALAFPHAARPTTQHSAAGLQKLYFAGASIFH